MNDCTLSELDNIIMRLNMTLLGIILPHSHDSKYLLPARMLLKSQKHPQKWDLTTILLEAAKILSKSFSTSATPDKIDYYGFRIDPTKYFRCGLIDTRESLLMHDSMQYFMQYKNKIML
jgi:hypothetical protein